MNKITPQYKIKNHTLLALSTTALCMVADSANASGLEDISRSIVALVMGDLGKAVFLVSVIGGGGVALWAQDISRACRIIGVGALLGVFISAINDGSFTRFITVG